jgi:hypothetical protein
MRRTALLGAVALAACGPSAASTTPAPARETVTAAELRRDLMVFAADSFMGREAGTPGELRAVRFLESRLRQLGLRPAGDSGYVQRVPLVRQRFGRGTRIVVTNRREQVTLPLGEQLMPMTQLGPGVFPRLDAQGEIVFAGYGVNLPSIERNDLAGLDLAGKVVVVVNDVPEGVDAAQRAQLEGQSGLGVRIGSIAARNPAAIIVLLTGDFADQFRTALPQLSESVVLASQATDIPDSQRRAPMVLLGVARQGSPLLPTGWPSDDRAQPLVGRSLRGHIEIERAAESAYNVAAVVPGRDPRLSGSYVAFGAHLDHIGIVPGAADTIANGADDDGSGSVALLAVARAFARSPSKPRRSMLFVWHTAEEKGLLGSEWFTSHPPVRLDSIVAQVNADMIGRNGRDSIHVVGPGTAPGGQSRLLGQVVDSVNAALPNPFRIDRAFDSPSDPEQIYYRSDHYNYAKRGIPIVFFTSGLHDDYHKVSDEASRIDYEKLARVARLFYEIGVAVGNRQSRLVAPTP